MTARKSRFRFAGLLSLGLHAALLAGLLLWFSHTPPPAMRPTVAGAVELVLVEQRGLDVPTAPPEPAPADRRARRRQPTARATAAAPPSPPRPAATADEALPLPPVPPPSAAADRATRRPAPPVQHAQEAPQINLGGNSETNAIVIAGPHVIPASVDAKFRNRQPVYPPRRGAPRRTGCGDPADPRLAGGSAVGVDVAQSSGFVLLDRAARDAVLGWHFLPAVQDGQPIPFDMKLRVVFHLE